MSTGDTDRGSEDPCPSCGAMVRRGLVRCWSCSAFMRPDVAAAYERMQARTADVEFKPLPEQTAGAPSGPAGSSRTGVESQSDDDFELTGSMNDAPVGDFELGAQFAPTASEDRTGGGISAFSGGQRKTDSAAPSESEKSPAVSPAAETKEKRRSAAENESDVPHSVATAGDALLQVALQEERELERRGGRRKAGFNPTRVADGWMITCPCPARVRIKIKEAHRGKTGKCPNPSCGSYFTVPADLPMDGPDQAATAGAAADAASGFPADPADKAGAYTHWLRDVRLHAVKPAKAKRKPGGHEKDFQPADLAFSKTDGVAAIALATKPAGLMARPKKPEQLREEFVAELRAGKPVGDLASTAKFTFEPNILGKLIVEYPPAYEHESTFAGVPVFGEGRIAIKLPPAGAPDEQHFVSLTLSQYQRLQELLDGLFEIQQFGLGCPIPRNDDVVNLVCHYSEDTLTVLRNPSYHLVDPEMELETVGYRCESCGLIVSENSRKKEKIGGLEGKKLASAKCPKCKGKFGNNPLYTLKPKAATPASEGKSEEAPETAESTAS